MHDWSRPFAILFIHRREGSAPADETLFFAVFSDSLALSAFVLRAYHFVQDDPAKAKHYMLLQAR